MTQYILAVLTLIVLFALLRLWVTAYDLKKLQARLEALENAKTALQANTQWAEHNIQVVLKDVEELQSTVAKHHEDMLNLASRISQQRSGATPMQQYSPEAAAAVRKRSTPRKPS